MVTSDLPCSWVERWRNSDAPAFVFEGTTRRYAELAEAIDSTAAALDAHGVGPGDRVSWIGLNHVELFEVLFACALRGAIFNPLNNRLTTAELSALVADAEPTMIVTTEDFVEVARSARSQSGCGASVVDIEATPLRAPATEGAPSVDRPAASEAPVVVDAGDPLLMVYTSGTTGRAKGAVLSHGAVAQTVANGIGSQALVADDVIISGLPTFHVGGLNIQVLPALCAGAQVVLMRRFDPTEFLDLVAVHRPTQAVLVPAMLDAIAGHPGFETADLGCFRGIMSGSSVVPLRSSRPWSDRGIPVGQVYGTTETGPTAVVLSYDDAAARPTSAGRQVAPSELRIVNGIGDVCAPGEAGEIQVRGANVFTEYWRNADATDAAFVGDWYRTGDVGSVDADGWLTVSDRLGDMYISGGENVYPAEVEVALAEHPAIAEISIVGRPDDVLGEVGVAFVVLDGQLGAHGVAEPGMPGLGIDELRNWANDRLARFKQPRELRIVDELPRTALGKVTKHVLRDELR